MKTLLTGILLTPLLASAQLKWTNVDSLYQPLPSSVHVFFTDDSLDGKPNRAFYAEAGLQDKRLDFSADTSWQRRLTPLTFFEKNLHPLLVVNCTFFEFVHNSNLNVVVNNRKILAYNKPVEGRGKDTLTYRHTFGSAIGISKKRKADVAWTYADSLGKYIYAVQSPVKPIKNSVKHFDLDTAKYYSTLISHPSSNVKLAKWKMKTAVGGGPVLVQNGMVRISNNEELKFAGKAIDDKHPRTCMGYTRDGRLIVMVIQGRFAGVAEGADLVQAANMMKDVGCLEALNLDGGGSSCMLVNGKETIQPSDKVQRPIPAVFLINEKH